MPRVDTLGVLVAGGRGRRLGSTAPKAMARVAGTTLLERAIAALEPCCDAIVVAAPAERPLDLPRALARALIRVADAPGAAGPLAGAVAGLHAIAHTRALVLGVDFPLLRSATLAALLARLPGRRAVIPAPGGVLQPLAAAYAGSAARALARRLAAGEGSISAAARDLDPLVLGEVELAGLGIDLDEFLNVNLPEDLDRAEWSLRARQPSAGAV